MTVLANARVVTPGGVLDRGWVQVDGGRITGLGPGPAPAPGVDLDGSWLVPGFVDLHMHGGGGHDVTRSRADLVAAVEFHRRHGTTTTLVSLMTAPVDALCEQLGWAAELTATGAIAGAHLEGPFLASARCGAQNRDHLLRPDRLVFAKLAEAAQGSLQTVTLAPELPGALELVADIRAVGARAAVGHTDASYEQARAAFAGGAELATHLFNAMGPISQRAPGASVAALDSPGTVLELINDGVHVHAGLARLAARCGDGRLALITDAISAAGVGDGEYTLGDQPVRVRSGQARLDGTDSLAGSLLTMDAALRRGVRDLGLSIEQAVAAAATTPARLLGLEERRGSIAVGRDADLVVLGAQLHVQRVLARGEWV